MAIVFELVVGFGHNREAGVRAVELVKAHPLLSVADRAIDLLEPWFYEVESGWLFSVAPAGVGFGLAQERGKPRHHLTAVELSELARGLYALLRRFDGYLRATVDWDPEDVVECADLDEAYGDELAGGNPHGLVLAEAVRRSLSVESARHFEPFAPGYDWIPYRGHSRGNTR
jgi:hypothetical protein